MKRFISQFKKTFSSFVLVTFIYEIEKYLSDCKTILDVGCGDSSPIRFFEKKYYNLGIDGHRPSIKFSKQNKIHVDYIIGNLKNLGKLVKKKSFDAVMALDVIEHFNKQGGYKLLDDMEKIAKNL